MKTTEPLGISTNMWFRSSAVQLFGSFRFMVRGNIDVLWSRSIVEPADVDANSWSVVPAVPVAVVVAVESGGTEDVGARSEFLRIVSMLGFSWTDP